jgi:hypothetical protein
MPIPEEEAAEAERLGREAYWSAGREGDRRISQTKPYPSPPVPPLPAAAPFTVMPDTEPSGASVGHSPPASSGGELKGNR